MRREHRSCKDCSYFYITHDPAFPYGCHCMGFKSRRYPHLEVEAATGALCVSWERRTNKDPAQS